MKRHLTKYMAVLFCAAMPVFSGAAVSAEALEPFDISAPCSLTLSLIAEDAGDRPCTGAVIDIYRAADAEIREGTVVYHYTEDFSGCTASLADFTDTAAATQISTYAAEHALPFLEQTVDASGSVSWNRLETGLYLITAVSVPEGFVPFEPFLLALPQEDDGFWNYLVTAEPKLIYAPESHTEVHVKKVWEGDNGVHPVSVTVRLMNDNGVFDTVTLSAENEWSYEWDALADTEHWYVAEENIPAGYVVSYANHGTEYIIKNTKTVTPPATPQQGGGKLYQTGQLNWPVPILAGGGMLLILIGTAVKSLGRKRTDEE